MKNNKISFQQIREYCKDKDMTIVKKVFHKTKNIYGYAVIDKIYHVYYGVRYGFGILFIENEDFDYVKLEHLQDGITISHKQARTDLLATLNRIDYIDVLK